MFQGKFLRDENVIIASENEKVVFQANLIFISDSVVLDQIRLSDSKTEELSKGDLFKNSVSFLNLVQTSVKSILEEENIFVNRVTLGSFYEVKKFDKIAQKFDEENYLDVNTKGMR